MTEIGDNNKRMDKILFHASVPVGANHPSPSFLPSDRGYAPPTFEIRNDMDDPGVVSISRDVHSNRNGGIP